MSAVFKNEQITSPAHFGLLSPATLVIEDSSAHWTSEFSYETSECAATVKLQSNCNSTTEENVPTNSGGPLFREYVPFTVVTEFQCSTMGYSPEDLRDMAIDYSNSCLQKALEYEFWTGSLAKAMATDGSWDAGERGPFPNRYLASSDSLDVTPTVGTGVKAKFGLALLEKSLGDCGCGSVGTIHATRDVASALNIKSRSDEIITNLGNFLIAGSGYDGSGPDGSDPGSGRSWMYATGPVTVRLDSPIVIPDTPSQAVSITTNTIKFSILQSAAITWSSCCHAGVLVDLNLDYA